jgi:signal transduction histidine kinase
MLIMNSRDFNERISIENVCSRDLFVLGDAQRLKQVFWNLLINACQAMPQGGVIRLQGEPVPVSGSGEDRVSITASDTGEGIGPDHIEKIFDPFFTTKSEGTGLGLAIVNRIITDHNGTIDVESEPGKGTRVRISLQAAEAPVSAFTERRLMTP